MLFQIKHRLSGSVLFELQCGSLKLCVEAAVRKSADLGYADLRYADLGSANLVSANLRYADLVSANLRYADLRSANLGYADLRYADLGSAKGVFSQGPFSTGRLMYCTSSHIYMGCRTFTYKEALNHWGNPDYRGEFEQSDLYQAISSVKHAWQIFHPNERLNA